MSCCFQKWQHAWQLLMCGPVRLVAPCSTLEVEAGAQVAEGACLCRLQVGRACLIRCKSTSAALGRSRSPPAGGRSRLCQGCICVVARRWPAWRMRAPHQPCDKPLAVVALPCSCARVSCSRHATRLAFSCPWDDPGETVTFGRTTPSNVHRSGHAFAGVEWPWGPSSTVTRSMVRSGRSATCFRRPFRRKTRSGRVLMTGSSTMSKFSPSVWACHWQQTPHRRASVTERVTRARMQQRGTVFTQQTQRYVCWSPACFPVGEVGGERLASVCGDRGPMATSGGPP